jgi:hypothetical protein
VPALIAFTSSGDASKPTRMIAPGLIPAFLIDWIAPERRRPAGGVDRRQVLVRRQASSGRRRALRLVAVGLELRDDLDLAPQRAEPGEHAVDAVVEGGHAGTPFEDSERVARLQLRREELAGQTPPL